MPANKHISRDERKNQERKVALSAFGPILEQLKDPFSNTPYRIQMLADEKAVDGKIEGKNIVYVGEKVEARGYPCKVFDGKGETLILFYVNAGIYKNIEKIITDEGIKAKAIAAPFKDRLNKVRDQDDIDECALVFSTTIAQEKNTAVQEKLREIKNNLIKKAEGSLLEQKLIAQYKTNFNAIKENAQDNENIPVTEELQISTSTLESSASIDKVIEDIRRPIPEIDEYISKMQNFIGEISRLENEETKKELASIQQEMKVLLAEMKEKRTFIEAKAKVLFYRQKLADQKPLKILTGTLNQIESAQKESKDLKLSARLRVLPDASLVSATEENDEEKYNMVYVGVVKDSEPQQYLCKVFDEKGKAYTPFYLEAGIYHKIRILKEKPEVELSKKLETQRIAQQPNSEEGYKSTISELNDYCKKIDIEIKNHREIVKYERNLNGGSVSFWQKREKELTTLKTEAKILQDRLVIAQFRSDLHSKKEDDTAINDCIMKISDEISKKPDGAIKDELSKIKDEAQVWINILAFQRQFAELNDALTVPLNPEKDSLDSSIKDMADFANLIGEKIKQGQDKSLMPEGLQKFAEIQRLAEDATNQAIQKQREKRTLGGYLFAPMPESEEIELSPNVIYISADGRYKILSQKGELLHLPKEVMGSAQFPAQLKDRYFQRTVLKCLAEKKQILYTTFQDWVVSLYIFCEVLNAARDALNIEAEFSPFRLGLDKVGIFYEQGQYYVDVNKAKNVTNYNNYIASGQAWIDDAIKGERSGAMGGSRSWARHLYLERFSFDAESPTVLISADVAGSVPSIENAAQFLANIGKSQAEIVVRNAVDEAFKQVKSFKENEFIGIYSIRQDLNVDDQIIKDLERVLKQSAEVQVIEENAEIYKSTKRELATLQRELDIQEAAKNKNEESITKLNVRVKTEQDRKASLEREVEALKLDIVSKENARFAAEEASARHAASSSERAKKYQELEQERISHEAVLATEKCNLEEKRLEEQKIVLDISEGNYSEEIATCDEQIKAINTNRGKNNQELEAFSKKHKALLADKGRLTSELDAFSKEKEGLRKKVWAEFQVEIGGCIKSIDIFTAKNPIFSGSIGTIFWGGPKVWFRALFGPNSAGMTKALINAKQELQSLQSENITKIKSEKFDGITSVLSAEFLKCYDGLDITKMNKEGVGEKADVARLYNNTVACKTQLTKCEADLRVVKYQAKELDSKLRSCDNDLSAASLSIKVRVQTEVGLKEALDSAINKQNELETEHKTFIANLKAVNFDMRKLEEEVAKIELELKAINQKREDLKPQRKEPSSPVSNRASSPNAKRNKADEKIKALTAEIESLKDKQKKQEEKLGICSATIKDLTSDDLVRGEAQLIKQQKEIEIIKATIAEKQRTLNKAMEALQPIQTPVLNRRLTSSPARSSPLQSGSPRAKQPVSAVTADEESMSMSTSNFEPARPGRSVSMILPSSGHDAIAKKPRSSSMSSAVNMPKGPPAEINFSAPDVSLESSRVQGQISPQSENSSPRILDSVLPKASGNNQTFFASESPAAVAGKAEVATQTDSVQTKSDDETTSETKEALSAIGRIGLRLS